jgi:hypothetical protein
MQQRVGPGGEQAAGLEHPPNFGKELLVAEPVQGLRHGDQVTTAVGQAAGFGRTLPVSDSRMGRCLRQLFGRQVGGMDLAEMLGQRQRGLAVAGGAVPGQIRSGGLRGEPGEELRRIGGPMARVVRGVARKVVGGQGVRHAR